MPDTDELKWSTLAGLVNGPGETGTCARRALFGHVLRARLRHEKRRKHETNTVFIQTTLHRFRPSSRVYAKSFEDIGTAAMQSRRASRV